MRAACCVSHKQRRIIALWGAEDTLHVTSYSLLEEASYS